VAGEFFLNKVGKIYYLIFFNKDKIKCISPNIPKYLFSDGLAFELKFFSEAFNFVFC
jgi:hypothetical protein